MPVNTTTNKTSVVLTSTTEAVAVPYVFWDDGDLDVIVTDQSTNLDTTLTLTTHYTVSGGDGSTGTVTLNGVSGDVAIGDTLTVARDIPYTQTMDLEEGDPLPSATLEQRIDRLTVQIQQVKALADRALRVGVTSGAITEGDIKDPTELFLYINSSDTLSGLTAAQVAALAAFTGTVNTVHIFADTTARNADTPDIIGQLGFQKDTNDIYYATATTAGSWSLFADNAAVTKALFDANTILAAITDDTPAAVTIAEDRVAGRITGGNISGLTISQVLNILSNTRGVIPYCGASNTWAALATGTSGQFLQTQGAGADPQWATITEGVLAQRTSTVDRTAFSTTSSFPDDNTIPQNTEGAEVFTHSHTPLDASNKLVIRVYLGLWGLGAGNHAGFALFKDSDADALEGIQQVAGGGGNTPNANYFEHEMTAGGTSAITFKLRAGRVTGSATLWINEDNTSADNWSTAIGARIEVLEFTE